MFTCALTLSLLATGYFDFQSPSHRTDGDRPPCPCYISYNAGGYCAWYCVNCDPMHMVSSMAYLSCSHGAGTCGSPSCTNCLNSSRSILPPLAGDGRKKPLGDVYVDDYVKGGFVNNGKGITRLKNPLSKSEFRKVFGRYPDTDVTPLTAVDLFVTYRDAKKIDHKIYVQAIRVRVTPLTDVEFPDPTDPSKKIDEVPPDLYTWVANQTELGSGSIPVNAQEVVGEMVEEGIAAVTIAFDDENGEKIEEDALVVLLALERIESAPCPAVCRPSYGSSGSGGWRSSGRPAGRRELQFRCR